MSVLAFLAQAQFTLTVWSNVVEEPGVRWQNTWEVYAGDPGDQTDLIALADSIAEFHAIMSYSDFAIRQVRVSTHAEDSHPYDPAAFFVKDYNLVGGRPKLEAQLLPLRQVLHIRRITNVGRLGKLFLRGCLTDGDTNTTPSGYVLADEAGMTGQLETAITDSGLDAYLSNFPAVGALSIAMLPNEGDPGGVRAVNALSVGGVQDIKLNHKYFDKAL